MGAVFRDNLQLEKVNDVVSGMAMKQVGVDVLVEFGDSRSNHSRDIMAARYSSRSLCDVRTTTNGPCGNRQNALTDVWPKNSLVINGVCFCHISCV